MNPEDPKNFDVFAEVPESVRGDADPTTPTGRYRALKREFRLEKIFTALLALIALLVSLGGIFGGYRVFIGDARAQTKEQLDAGLNPVLQRVSGMEKVLERHLDDDAQKTRLQAESNYRAAIEIRELQKVILSGQPSDVLNKPPPKPPDAGR